MIKNIVGMAAAGMWVAGVIIADEVSTSAITPLPSAANQPARDNSPDQRSHRELPAVRHRVEPDDTEALREEQLSGMLRVVVPRHQDYRHALGLELQWTLWFGPSLGLAICAGADRWSVDAREYFSHETMVLRPRVDGSALALPVGGSLMYRSKDLGRELRLTVELGLRFAYISSDITMTYDFVDHYRQHTVVQDTVDLDPRLLAIGRIELSGHIHESWNWFINGGYQKDFEQGENWLYEDVANDLSGIVISAGVRRRL